MISLADATDYVQFAATGKIVSASAKRRSASHAARLVFDELPVAVITVAPPKRARAHRRLDRFDPSRSDRPAGISIRRPWWSVRKASKMRSDHLEVLVCSQQGKAIFATGDRNQDVVDQ